MRNSEAWLLFLILHCIALARQASYIRLFGEMPGIVHASAEQCRYRKLLRSLKRQMLRHEHSDEGPRRYAREIWNGLSQAQWNRFLNRYEAEGRVLGNWLYLPDVEIGGQDTLIQ